MFIVLLPVEYDNVQMNHWIKLSLNKTHKK